MLYSSVWTRVPGVTAAMMTGLIVACCTLASMRSTTCPPRWIRPRMGGLSFSSVPRPGAPASLRQRPSRPFWQSPPVGPCGQPRRSRVGAERSSKGILLTPPTEPDLMVVPSSGSYACFPVRPASGERVRESSSAASPRLQVASANPWGVAAPHRHEIAGPSKRAALHPRRGVPTSGRPSDFTRARPAVAVCLGHYPEPLATMAAPSPCGTGEASPFRRSRVYAVREVWRV